MQALLAMQTAVVSSASLSLSVRHVPVFYPDKWRYDHASASIQVGKVYMDIRMGVTPSEGVKVKHPLSLAKIWQIIGHNLETVQDKR